MDREMNTPKLFPLIIQWLYLSSCTTTAQYLTMRETLFYRMANHSLGGHVTATSKVTDAVDCSLLCLSSGPWMCLSFNFGGVLKDGRYTCELSDSERRLKPQSMQQESHFHYYGTVFEHLVIFYPCVATPCRYSGQCIHGPDLGEYSCQCGLEIAVLPYIGNNCDVDLNLVETSDSVANVFHIKVGTYQLDFYESHRLCEMFGATLASPDQLSAAWEAEMNFCAFGWLTDATFRYPMQVSRPGCGNAIGIMGSSIPQDKSTKRNAWCYKGS